MSKKKDMPEFFFKTKTVSYIKKGRGDLLIILPGNTASSKVYQPQIDYLSKYFLVVSIDYLGVGESERIKDSKANWWKYSAEQVACLISHLEYKQAIIAGSSGGAIIGMHLAANHPDRVKSLILDSFSLYFTIDMFEKNVKHQRMNPNKDQEEFWKFCHGEDWLTVINKDTKNIERMVKKGGDWLEGCHKKIKCPTLLLGSESDEFLPDIKEDFTILSKHILNCDFALTPIGNHPVIWTNTEFYMKELKKFLGINRPHKM